jgi:hypothetical protein
MHASIRVSFLLSMTHFCNIFCLTLVFFVTLGGRRNDGLKAADIVPVLRERVAYLSGIRISPTSTNATSLFMYYLFYY